MRDAIKGRIQQQGLALAKEQEHMLAILRSAVHDFQKCVHEKGGIEKKLFREAEEWILEKDIYWLFSFENICESLQLQPKYIRRGLLSWKKVKRAETLPTRPEATAANSIPRTLRQQHMGSRPCPARSSIS